MIVYMIVFLHYDYILILKHESVKLIVKSS